jgi:hypothetical protein
VSHEHAASPLVVAPSGADRPRDANDDMILRERAEAGDAATAYRLARRIDECSSHRPSTDAAIAQDVVDLYAQHDEPPRIIGVTIEPDEMLAMHTRAQRELDALCVGHVAGTIARDSRRSEAFRLIEAAAVAGHAAAQVQYIEAAFGEYAHGRAAYRAAEEILRRRNQALAYLESARAAGNRGALLALAISHTEDGVFPRDDAVAAAHRLAYLRAGGERLPAALLQRLAMALQQRVEREAWERVEADADRLAAEP